jgi:hypothetical protein
MHYVAFIRLHSSRPSIYMQIHIFGHVQFRTPFSWGDILWCTVTCMTNCGVSQVKKRLGNTALCRLKQKSVVFSETNAAASHNLQVSFEQCARHTGDNMSNLTTRPLGPACATGTGLSQLAAIQCPWPIRHAAVLGYSSGFRLQLDPDHLLDPAASTHLTSLRLPKHSPKHSGTSFYAWLLFREVCDSSGMVEMNY